MIQTSINRLDKSGHMSYALCDCFARLRDEPILNAIPEHLLVREDRLRLLSFTRPEGYWLGRVMLI